MKVRCIYRDSKFLKYNKIYEVLEEIDKSYKVKDEDGEESNFYKWKFEEVKEMEKTFREVIADIKEGEVWESVSGIWDIKTVEKAEGCIKINRAMQNSNDLYISEGCKFRLQRKEYTFQEAFKAYEEGKEIENKNYKYKKRNGIDCFKLGSEKYGWYESENGFEIHLDEIRGKWYINEVD